MAKSSPAWPCYAQDILVGTALMSKEEVGIYFYMLNYQWVHCGLPSNQKQLKTLLNVRRDVPLVVLSKFRVCEDGLLRNDRMEEERLKQGRFSESRRASALHRWSERNAHASGTHDDTHSERNAISLQSSPSVLNATINSAGARPNSVEEVIAYGKSPHCGLTEDECKACFDHYESTRQADGRWQVQGQPVNDWKARVRTWKNNRGKFSPAIARKDAPAVKLAQKNVAWMKDAKSVIDWVRNPDFGEEAVKFELKSLKPIIDAYPDAMKWILEQLTVDEKLRLDDLWPR